MSWRGCWLSRAAPLTGVLRAVDRLAVLNEPEISHHADWAIYPWIPTAGHRSHWRVRQSGLPPLLHWTEHERVPGRTAVSDGPARMSSQTDIDSSNPWFRASLHLFILVCWIGKTTRRQVLHIALCRRTRLGPSVFTRNVGMQVSYEAAASSRLQSALAALPALAEAIGEDAAQREAKRELPFDGFALFRQSGLGVLRLPEEWGGLGGTLEDLFEVVTTLAAHESNVAHALRIHFDITEALLLSPRSTFNDTQIERIRAGAIFGGASTEAGTSRPGEITTKLVRDGEHFRISGRKFYSTGTAFSDYARINVQDENDENVAIVIPVAREGLQVLDDWDGMGQRMTASGSLVLDNVQVYAHEVALRGSTTLVGRHGGALRQLHLVAVAAGIVRNVVADAHRYVTQYGRPVLHSPAPSSREDGFVQQVVGDLAAHSLSIDALVNQNARTLERSAHAIRQGASDADERVLEGALATAKTQLVVSKLALYTAERLFEVGGASATARSHNFDRHWRNLRTIFSHNPLLHKARVIGDYELNGVTTHLKEGRVF